MNYPIYTILPVTNFVLYRQDGPVSEVVCEFLSEERARIIAEAMARGSGGVVLETEP